MKKRERGIIVYESPCPTAAAADASAAEGGGSPGGEDAEALRADKDPAACAFERERGVVRLDRESVFPEDELLIEDAERSD